MCIQRAGDVIPQVLYVDKEKRNKNGKKFNFPEKCPSCGSKTIKEFNYSTKKRDAVTRCPDPKYNCIEILREKLKHYVSKYSLNIDPHLVHTARPNILFIIVSFSTSRLKTHKIF